MSVHVLLKGQDVFSGKLTQGMKGGIFFDVINAVQLCKISILLMHLLLKCRTHFAGMAF